MAVKKLSNEVELYKKAYDKFWNFCHEKEFEFCKIEDYNLYTRNKRIGYWYDSLEIDFTREILNLVNQFSSTTNKIIVWNEVYSSYSEEKDRFDLLMEFIKYPVYYCLHQPHAIQQKIIYSSIHLCNQADVAINGAVDYIPKIKDKNGNSTLHDAINIQTLKKMSKKWDDSCKLVKCLKKLPSEKFIKGTQDYRNLAQHKTPPYIEYGHTNVIERVTNRGESDSARYAIGGLLPLQLKLLIPILKSEYENCKNSLSLYWNLVKKHEEFSLD
ncbi:hypothetical protein IQ218_11230 [Synechocystis salina LEGE 06099]|uniref:hypothetical protein n=1 Tax=Synechocystis salina TaxID=945780 RepID=UPI00187FEA4F|nr:hypothetical protein [Synechocystis salina]MBE9203911.1 hypothetical protein [Synechocystis salina LEGE 06099]